MQRDLTRGPIARGLLLFALPLMAGNLLQQLYNVADTWVVGRFLGSDALAAVGSSYTLMTFLTSIFLGLCMGSGTAFSIQYGRRDMERFKRSLFVSFLLIAGITLLLTVLVFVLLDWILLLMQTPPELMALMRQYLWCIFWGIPATFLYNYFANVLRSVGNSAVPLLFLAISAIMNIVLDLVFVLVFHWGVAGAAIATVISQYFSGIGILLYTLLRFPDLRIHRRHMRWDSQILKEISHFSFLTCVQQSVMNLGILMVQGCINSFGTVIMAAFAAAVKIDSFAYMPVQDFGNAFSTYVAQNYGAGQTDRIRKGIRTAFVCVLLFCILITSLVCLFARPLMLIFVDASEAAILNAGVQYLYIEASFYIGIGILFMLYGYYRAVGRPGISVVLTVISLGTRVVLAYTLSAIPSIGVIGIWISVPIGWFLADLTGILLYRHTMSKKHVGKSENT